MWEGSDEATRRGMAGEAETGRGARGALKLAPAGRDGVARPDRPSRWTLPITALRVTPPSCLAIWLALRPSSQSFFSEATRSSVQPPIVAVIVQPPAVRRPGGCRRLNLVFTSGRCARLSLDLVPKRPAIAIGG